MQSSNIANPSIPNSPLKDPSKFEEIPDNFMKNSDPDKIPLLFIDVKIAQDQISRLVLYRNQTPVEAAADFILQYDIPVKLRPYLICKVNAHYEKYIKKNNIIPN